MWFRFLNYYTNRPNTRPLLFPRVNVDKAFPLFHQFAARSTFLVPAAAWGILHGGRIFFVSSVLRAMLFSPFPRTDF